MIGIYESNNISPQERAEKRFWLTNERIKRSKNKSREMVIEGDLSLLRSDDLEASFIYEKMFEL
ncbi:MAG: hypothetical protein KDE30_13130 [Novosphingobium sp.]|nr:hypothetical protein [Ignavibacteriota bacterium]MCB2058844.1 hypothetical protein [Novosphingobium sp.]